MSRAGRAPPVDRRPGHRITVALGAVAAALTVFTVVAAIVPYPYTVLLPDRSDEEASVGLLMGLVTMVIAVARLLLAPPKLRLGFLIIPLLGLAALLAGFLLGSGAAVNWYKLYDFRHRPIVPINAYLRVSRFYQTYSKGPHFHAALTDFSPVLDVDATDYVHVAGASKHLTVTGKCIRVRLERSSRAVRIVGPDHVRAVPCPAIATPLHLG